jgi:hypothetical protein
MSAGKFVYLLPAVIKNAEPELTPDLALLKRQLSVKDASNVDENDIESMALGSASPLDQTRSLHQETCRASVWIPFSAFFRRQFIALRASRIFSSQTKRNC